MKKLIVALIALVLIGCASAPSAAVPPTYTPYPTYTAVPPRVYVATKAPTKVAPPTKIVHLGMSYDGALTILHANGFYGDMTCDDPSPARCVYMGDLASGNFAKIIGDRDGNLMTVGFSFYLYGPNAGDQDLSVAQLWNTAKDLGIWDQMDWFFTKESDGGAPWSYENSKILGDWIVGVQPVDDDYIAVVFGYIPVLELLP